MIVKPDGISLRHVGGGDERDTVPRVRRPID